ncbi:MAG: hypothetical protein ACI6PN_10805, partial [Polaribacter sp.]|uniref:hypothetical protein n=1 Tax=Polaribacter sp. TaxID=1920175 RepID=UPI00384F276D
VAKAAVPISAAILAARALKKRKRNAAIDMGIDVSNADSGSDMLSSGQVDSFLPDDGFITVNNPYGEGGAKKGGSAGRAKRSTITGVAVRGFGRALKGKK